MLGGFGGAKPPQPVGVIYDSIREQCQTYRCYLIIQLESNVKHIVAISFYTTWKQWHAVLFYNAVSLASSVSALRSSTISMTFPIWFLARLRHTPTCSCRTSCVLQVWCVLKLLRRHRFPWVWAVLGSLVYVLIVIVGVCCCIPLLQDLYDVSNLVLSKIETYTDNNYLLRYDKESL